MSEEKHAKLQPYMTPAHAWAFSVGTSIGWGSLVITCNTYLSQAGPVGSVLGLAIGGLVMLLISRSYHYMIDSCPEAGGVYAYSRDVFSYDHGFLTAWFLILTYLAIFWANATSLPLFARYFMGGLFSKGYLYSLFGYQVYLGEALLSMAAILLVALFCTRHKKTVAVVMTTLVGIFVLGILVCFLAAILPGKINFEPVFVPDESAISQIVRIACISPWAFIGFENISHSAEEFTFPHKRVFRILVISVVTTTLLYVCVTLLSVTAYPPQYSSWFSYMKDLGNLDGLEGLPAFYAARHYMGNVGVMVLMISLLALIITSLIGNMLALSRLFFALARDHIAPSRFASLNEKNIPAKAIWLVAIPSLLIPFLGRTAIGWIVDVTTIGATLIYGFVSAAAWKLARDREDKLEQFTGMAGLILMVGIGLYLFVPNLFTTGMMEPESYILFVAWAILGFIFFRVILKRDEKSRFGQSIIVWIALLSLVLFISLIWMSQTIMSATGTAMTNIQEFYRTGEAAVAEDAFMNGELLRVRNINAFSILVVVGLFALSLGVLLNNYSIMSRRARESEQELGHVKRIANTDPLTGVKSKHAYADLEKRTDQNLQEAADLQPFALAVCDVNGLKFINDTLGHKAGDEYIKAACHLICELFQHSPVYRIGGDEFVVFLTGRDYENQKSILDTLNERVEAHIGTGEVVVSVGVADYRPGEDRTMHTVFERADARMYERKQELKKMGAKTR